MGLFDLFSKKQSCGNSVNQADTIHKVHAVNVNPLDGFRNVSATRQ